MVCYLFCGESPYTVSSHSHRERFVRVNELLADLCAVDMRGLWSEPRSVQNWQFFTLDSSLTLIHWVQNSKVQHSQCEILPLDMILKQLHLQCLPFSRPPSIWLILMLSCHSFLDFTKPVLWRASLPQLCMYSLASPSSHNCGLLDFLVTSCPKFPTYFVLLWCE
jgi:hypothetical protein